MNAAPWAAVGTCVTAAVYVVILVYAIKQVNEAKTLRRSQTRPFVVVDIAPGYLLYITVENIGATLARKVRFEFPVPMTAAIEEPWDVAETPLFKDGVDVLPPRKRYRVFFDSFTQRLERNDLPMSYEVIVHYEDDNGHKFIDTYTLDLNSFMHTSPEEDGVPKLAAELVKINKTLNKWTDGVHGLLVHARNKDDMLARDRERYEESRPQRARQAVTEASDPSSPRSEPEEG